MATPPEIASPAHAAEMAVWTALGGGNSGIKGNRLHTYGFHRGAAYIPAKDYSRRRDPKGGDGPFPNWGWCCAGDFHHGGKPVLRARHLVLLTRLLDGDPTLDSVCEFIGQPWPDKPVIYWARWEGPRHFRRYTGQGHDMWSHVSIYRSLAGKPPGLWTPASAAIETGKGTPATKPTTVKPIVLKAPPWPKGTPAYFRASPRAKYSPVVRAWQARMRQRGWKIKVDGYYGAASAEIALAFQREKKLGADGLLGPKTFAAAWTARVTS